MYMFNPTHFAVGVWTALFKYCWFWVLRFWRTHICQATSALSSDVHYFHLCMFVVSQLKRTHAREREGQRRPAWCKGSNSVFLRCICKTGLLPLTELSLSLPFSFIACPLCWKCVEPYRICLLHTHNTSSLFITQIPSATDSFWNHYPNANLYSLLRLCIGHVLMQFNPWPFPD